MRGRDLFDAVVAASRLNALVAPYTITRLLVRSNASPDTVTPEELAGALPRIEEGLGVYLGEADVAAAMADIRRLAAPEQQTTSPRG
jgi:hypothetical protein